MKRTQDCHVDNYITRYGIITDAQREKMVSLILDLHRQKQYRTETAHLAVSVADRYLSAIGLGPYPDLVHLAAISILIAAKVEQPMSPSFNRMIDLLPGSYKMTTHKRDLIRLELSILSLL
jgi:hypothetical protein